MGKRWLKERGYDQHSAQSRVQHSAKSQPNLPSGQGPLFGVKILDLTRYQNGPSATRRLADYGADVIKIEHPDGGDQGRGLIFTPDKFDVFFEAFNRGKRSICVNLQKEQSKPIMHRLVQWADVLAENFRQVLLYTLPTLTSYMADRECCHRGGMVTSSLEMSTHL